MDATDTQYLSDSVQGQYPPDLRQERSWFQRTVLYFKAILFYIGHNILGGYTLQDLSMMIERNIVRPKNIRHLFVTNDPIHFALPKNSHSHPTAAMFRSATNVYMNNLATKSGYTPYNVSCSATDIAPGSISKASRYFYGMKDLAIPYRNDPVDANDCLIFTDVDYYADIQQWMSYFRPMLLYTFVPQTTVGRALDSAFRLIGDEVEFVVSGGASYRHKLWRYDGDVVGTHHDGDLLLFNIEQRLIAGDEHHRFIALTPMARVPWYLTAHLPGAKRMERTNWRSGEFNYLYEPISDKLSIARNGGWQSVEISGKAYMAINERLKNKTAPPVVSDVERLLNASKDPCAALNAPLLFSMLGVDIVKNVVKTMPMVAKSFYATGSLSTEDGKNPGSAVTSPLVSHPALFAEKGLGPDEACIRGRVDRVRNTKIPPRAYKQYANEFLSKVVSSIRGSPLSVEEVRQRQTAPQQKARFRNAMATLTTKPLNRLKSFIKSEPYATPNDPRNITTMAPELTIMLSCYTLAFKESCLKGHSWFGPGKTPTQIVKRLRQLGESKLPWIVTDYTRLDGTVSQFLQDNVVNACYMKWVAEEYRSELKHCLDQVFIQNGRTAEGLAFEPGFGTRSGSPQTTDGNTLVCAYVYFCANRLLGKSVSEAWDSLPLIYGDDAACTGTQEVADALSRASGDLGLKIKCDTVPAGRPVPFLGRYFVDPLTSNDSFQDPMRTLAKIHLTSNKGVLPNQAAANKALGYLATDSLTPVVSHWARRVLQITGISKTKGLTGNEAYKMSNAWPQRDPASIATAFAEVIGWDESEINDMRGKIALASALDQFPVLFNNTLPPNKIDCVVEGELCTGPRQEPKVSAQNEQEPAGTEGRPREVAVHSESIAKQANARPGDQAEGIRGQGRKPRTAATSSGPRGPPGENGRAGSRASKRPYQRKGPGKPHPVKRSGATQPESK